MFLKYRPIRLDDLQYGMRCTRDGFAYDAAAAAQLMEMWRELIVSGAANATLIEDLDLPRERRFLQFCIILFITPDFADYLRTEAPAPTARVFLDAWLAGSRPWLSLRDIRRANSKEGVSWTVLHSGPGQEVLQSTDWAAVGLKITDYAPWAISGYRANECFLEGYSPAEYAYAEDYGMFLCRDQTFKVNGQPDVRARRYHFTSEHARQRVGSGISEMFQYQPPKFFFSAGEQELLWCGLYGETDEELAEQLTLSPATIKKRWRDIYERVGNVAPELLGGGNEDAKRGGEKKRRLIQYIRHHMEELRPAERPRQK